MSVLAISQGKTLSLINNQVIKESLGKNKINLVKPKIISHRKLKERLTVFSISSNQTG